VTAPQIDAGTVRALGVTTLNPTALVRGIPAIAQSGLPGCRGERRRANDVFDFVDHHVASK